MPDYANSAFEPFFLPEPLSPPISAERAGIRIDTGQIVRQTQLRSAGQNLLLIESAGSWYAPISGRETMAHLACALCAPLVLVVEPRPGCLNHVLLTCNADPSADAAALRSAAVLLLARAA
ncbi:MAG: dethiobiotin synthase [Steroidobacteraceae bacterium]